MDHADQGSRMDPEGTVVTAVGTGDRGHRRFGALRFRRLTWGQVGTAVVLAVVAVNALVVRDKAAPTDLGWVDLATGAIGVALVLLRNRWPRGMLALALLVTVVSVAAAGRPTAILPAVVFLLFTVATRFERPVAVAAGMATSVVVLFALTVLTEIDRGPEAVVGSVVWPATAVAVGDAVRSRRAYVAAVEERARRAEETREEEARRRVAEERLRIARDLHDLVAHRIAVVNVQAGLAAHLMRQDPDGAEAALRVVRSSAGSVLDELGQMLGVLRQPDETDAPTVPTPTLDDLTALIASFADAGLAVTWATTGSPRPLGDAAQLAVYRTVQEGLTNAHKHGAGTARVELAFTPEELVVAIDNPLRSRPPAGRTVAPAPPGRTPPGGTLGDVPRPGGIATDPAGGEAGPRAGFGLIGMNERVTAAGGRLEIATGDGTHQVRARFPLAPAGTTVTR